MKFKYYYFFKKAETASKNRTNHLHNEFKKHSDNMYIHTEIYASEKAKRRGKD